MGNVRLYGATSGYTELAPPAVAPDGVLSLPTGVGTLLTAEGGKVLQVVRATDSTVRSTTSTSFVDANISVTITPQLATSAILLIWSVAVLAPATGYVFLQITDSSNTAISGAERGGLGTATSLNSLAGGLVNIGYATPATTSATTYKGRFKTTTATGVLQNTDMTSQLYAIEVSA